MPYAYPQKSIILPYVSNDGVHSKVLSIKCNGEGNPYNLTSPYHATTRDIREWLLINYHDVLHILRRNSQEEVRFIIIPHAEFLIWAKMIPIARISLHLPSGAEIQSPGPGGSTLEKMKVFGQVSGIDAVRAPIPIMRMYRHARFAVRSSVNGHSFHFRIMVNRNDQCQLWNTPYYSLYDYLFNMNKRPAWMRELLEGTQHLDMWNDYNLEWFIDIDMNNWREEDVLIPREYDHEVYAVYEEPDHNGVFKPVSACGDGHAFFMSKDISLADLFTDPRLLITWNEESSDSDVSMS